MAQDYDPLQRVMRGDSLEIRAESWNLFGETAKAFRSGRLFPNGPGGKERIAGHSLEVLVQNQTGADLAAFSPVITNGFPLYSGTPIDFNGDNYELYNRPAFAAAVSGATTDTPLVTTGPIKSGEIGRAVALGIAVTYLDAWDGSALRAGNYVQTIPGNATKVRKAATGPARLLWFDPLVSGHESDPRRCVINIGDGAVGTGTATGPIYARITGRSGGKYSFVQVTRDSSGTYIDVPSGITGSTAVGYAQDIGGIANDILFTPTNLPFLLTPNPTELGTWLFGPVSLCS